MEQQTAKADELGFFENQKQTFFGSDLWRVHGERLNQATCQAMRATQRSAVAQVGPCVAATRGLRWCRRRCGALRLARWPATEW